jgi:RNA polymerase sigma-70 factor, ECF subfamily
MISAIRRSARSMPSSPATPYANPALADRLLREAEVPDAWGITADQFAVALNRSAAQRFAGVSPDARTVETFLESLHCRDLALAWACATGNDRAWDFFLNEYRKELYRSARAIAGDTIGPEIANSLYADLYGLRGEQDTRKSPFEYFLGRSKLSTWLHAVLSRKHIDEIRRGRKLESLDAPSRDSDSGTNAKPRLELVSKTTAAKTDPDRARYLAILQTVLTAVLAALPARDRLRLAYYYVDELKLAAIGRILGEHEATVSRKIERSRQDIRAQVDLRLREEKKLSDAQLGLCYEYAREEWPFDLSGVLTAKQ